MSNAAAKAFAKPDMADLPAQLAAAPASAAEARARFFNSGNAFNIKLPPVPGGLFTAEPARALLADASTGFIACDQSAALGCAFPATTPLMLARYAVVAPGGRLAVDFCATGSIWYVIAGAGQADCAGERLAFGPGDVLLLPGAPAEIRAGAGRVVLWVVTNEPQLALDGDLPPDAAHRPVAPVHYPAAEIARQVEIIYDHAQNAETSGIALIFSCDTQAAARNILPSLTLSLNTLPAGEHQRAHRHNSAAITLVVQGEGCHSLVDGARCPWSPWATLVTPPGAPHSHHNGGGERALFLIVQDGGLHYHARTMGFSFLA
ncbi:cupin domain-containing protein [Xanthobacter dioxanivorans]|uniref:Cupin domain-containing protein n=1 Tax=Xanthobacter dioxanivorans TaxID=2528964 RepID=A0A974PJP8_9HYPH|nr:cupin domain-containing protein [Xanthobacter dioxanivorans]QRG04623.1 cupin domain-containing protein [Xanthobacter dioxanivorans]